MGDLYSRISELCVKRKITPGRLCNDLGMQRSVLGNLKSGQKKGLSAPTLQKIADYFGVTVDYLLGETDEKRPASDKSGDGPDVAKNDEERKILMLARHLEKIPEEKRARIVKNFEDTIDTYLEAMGLNKGDSDDS